MRLDKFLCKSTQLSRAEAVTAIQQGQVQVNQVETLDESSQVHENNHIVLNGLELKLRPSRYLMLHKPANYLSCNSDGAHPSAMRLLELDKTCDLHIAGRLDADTTGLLLITDDGRWSFDIIRPNQHCRKTYRLGLRDPLQSAAIKQFRQGLQLQGENNLTQPAELEILAPREARLTITEGKYHQVKRMFAAVGNKVRTLHREKIGQLELDIGVGQWRHLTEAEVASF